MIIECERGGQLGIVDAVFRAFNSFHPAVKFTIEHPDAEVGLPFLDMCVRLDDDHQLVYDWYQKPTHSGNLMHCSSLFSEKQKYHFMVNRFVSVCQRTNNNRGLNKGLTFMSELLTRNGYPAHLVRTALSAAVAKFNTWVRGGKKSKSVDKDFFKDKHTGRQLAPLKIPFLSDEFTAQVKRLVRQLDLPLVVVTAKSSQIKELGFKPKLERKCKGRCLVCPLLPKSAWCGMKNIVYEAICRRCGGTYIGKSSNSVYDRFCSHNSDLKRMAPSGPLSEHMLTHQNKPSSLADFKFRIVVSAPGPIETSIKESQCIRWFGPELNRKFENTFLF